LRPATLQDLEALVALEAHFPGDRLTRSSLRHFLSKGHAAVWLYELEGRVIGDAVVLFRRGFHVARLYSLVVDPAWRGQGIARLLLKKAEEEALANDCMALRLEVREDNEAAIGLYQKAGYLVVGRSDDYYEDHSPALRMRKFLTSQPPPELLQVPYYAQTLDFTCGPAALMMVMRYLRPELSLDRGLELQLWREATTIFMTSGHGGCSAHGLGLAALRRGLHATVYARDDAVPFLDSVRDSEKKDVITLSHQDFLRDFTALGGRTVIRDFGVADVLEALNSGGVPLILMSGYRLYREKMPHWLVITGYNQNFIYLHDPYIPEGTGLADSLNLPLRRSDFERASCFGKARHRYMVLICEAAPSTR
jgi:ribosomal protein S18 acetylase RimI-like enzyme